MLWQNTRWLALRGDDADGLAGGERAGVELGAADGGVADQGGVVADDRVVVMRVEEDRLGGDLEAAGEGDAEVDEGDGDGVAVGDDEAAGGVEDQAGAAEADRVDAVDLVGDRGVDGDEGGQQAGDAGVVAVREADGVGCGGGAGGGGGQAGPGDRPVASSRVWWVMANQRRSIVITATRSRVGPRGRSSGRSRGRRGGGTGGSWWRWRGRVWGGRRSPGSRRARLEGANM